MSYDRLLDSTPQRELLQVVPTLGRLTDASP